MKKLITALVGLGLIFSYNSHAFSNDCAKVGYSSGLCAPKNRGGFYFGVTGDYLLATGTGAELDTETIQSATTTSAGPTGIFRSRLNQFKPKYKWVYDITAGYDLPYSAYNIELSYMHLNDPSLPLHLDLSEHPVSIGATLFTNILIPVFPTHLITSTAGLTDFNGNATLQYSFDKIDLTYGRQYNDVCGFNFHPSLGIRYARMKHEYRSDTTGTYAVVPITGGIFADNFEILVNVHSVFRGIGPMFCLNTRYGLGGSFGIVSHFDTSLLVGTIDSHDHFAFTFTPVLGGGLTEIGQLLLSSADESFSMPHRNRLMTDLSGKLGVDYNYFFCNKSRLCVEVGYQACRYYNICDLMRGDVQSPLSSTALNSPTSQRITDTATDNFEMRGPYINVTYHL